MTRPRKKSRLKRDSNPGSSALEADALTTRPTRRLVVAVVGGGGDGFGGDVDDCDDDGDDDARL